MANQSNRKRQIVSRLRTFCGSESASIKQIMTFIGIKNYDTIHRFLSHVPHTGQGRLTRYHIEDIAERIYQAEKEQMA